MYKFLYSVTVRKVKPEGLERKNKTMQTNNKQQATQNAQRLTLEQVLTDLHLTREDLQEITTSDLQGMTEAVYSTLEEQDKAIDLLRQAQKEKSGAYKFLNSDYELNRYNSLLKNMEQAQKECKYKAYLNIPYDSYPLANVHQIEEETGRLSQAHLIDKLFNNCILANTLCENLIRRGCETGEVQELLTPYTIASAKEEAGEEVEDYEYYDDEYQYFLVTLEYDEETTIKILKRADTDIYLRYDNENDIYIMSIGNFGMSREMISTSLAITNDINNSNYWEDDEE